MLMFCDQTVVWKCIHCVMDESGEVRENQSDGSNTFLRRYNLSSNQSSKRTSLWKRLKNSGRRNKKKKETQKKKDAERGDTDFQLPETQEEKQVEQLGPSSQLLGYFSEVVSPFNTRKLTSSSDLPMAFRGIANFLAQNAPAESLFANGLCWGLPIAGMPDVLTWTAAGEDLRPRSSPPIFPSWSWFEWEGAVQGEKKRLAKDHFQTFNSRGRPSPACEWDIGNIHATSALPSLTWSSDAENGRYIRIVAETRVFNNWSHIIGGQVFKETFVWSEGFPLKNHDGTKILAMLFPDQLVEFASRNVAAVELLAVSEFTARLGDSPTLTFVKALWIERDEPRPECQAGHVTVHRRGVAIVERELWDEEVVKNTERKVLMLR
jgi:hypothetical protein